MTQGTLEVFVSAAGCHGNFWLMAITGGMEDIWSVAK